jgi:hypothetical protein
MPTHTHYLWFGTKRRAIYRDRPVLHPRASASRSTCPCTLQVSGADTAHENAPNNLARGVLLPWLRMELSPAADA